jgi:hypothetical protein
MKPGNIGAKWRTAPKKSTKANEPTTRDKLSASFLKAFQTDFETYGVETIEKLRAESPSKYAEIAAKLVTAIEPSKSEEVKDMRSLAIRLLKDVGADEYEITEDMIEQAIKRNEEFIDQLLAIKAAAEGQMQ